ncbi:unnamed protein product [Fraxinus pennsylvanica]|uniref:Retrotransposon Copia-like N-terminal domain-containing protein n=1 Tax=Fraxinus pennsylvanica TaxID=56036 RepID=A0AAD2DLU8_9LAMI|nr:unnamed protein product [Fraxinus pennsylvanica]
MADSSPTPNSSTSEIPVIISSQPNALISINTASQIPFKLSRGGNYASWRSQFSNLVFGYDLSGYIDGTFPCPDQMKTQDGNDEPSSNLKRKLWLRQDRLILQAIQVSLAGNIAPLISSCKTSAEAWNKLETTFANRSNTRMLTLLSTLMRTSQEDHETFLKREEGKKTAPLITAQYNQHRPNNKNRPENGYTNNGRGPNNNYRNKTFQGALTTPPPPMTNSASTDDDGAAISDLMLSNSTSNQSVPPSSSPDQSVLYMDCLLPEQLTCLRLMLVLDSTALLTTGDSRGRRVCYVKNDYTQNAISRVSPNE